MNAEGTGGPRRRFREGEWVEVEASAVVRGLPSSRKYATEFARVAGEDPEAGTVEIQLPREKGTRTVSDEDVRPSGPGAGRKGTAS